MSLLRARGVEKAFGDRLILRGCDLDLAPGERVGLVGANGCGKSTLLQILAGTSDPDQGEVVAQAPPALLDQDPVLPGQTVGDAIDHALEWHARLLQDFQTATESGDLDATARLQDQLDQVGWDLTHKAAAVMTQVQAPPRDAPNARLSGGERRRVALARALLGDQRVLLLDEPTNHLDADTVEWLQAHLAGLPGALILVTHDRYLLEAVATRIIEVEDGICVSYNGSYADYLVERAERRAGLQRNEDRRLALIAREAEWASRSPAARSTKQRARLDRLDRLKAQRPLKREEEFRLDLRSGRKLPSTVLELQGVTKGFGGAPLMTNLDLSLVPGDRLGIVGPNGCGKSTLLKLIQCTMQPDSGKVVRASRVKIAVLDQHRTGLPETGTVFDAAGNGNDWVQVGTKSVHVASFLGRFLFGREVLDQPVSKLSGGERARLLLARLMLEGANLLLLDEPTNDLDLQTLRVLEEALLDFDGCVVVVSHDRALLDRVCTGLLAFDGQGGTQRYADRMQLLADRRKQQAARAPAPKKAAPVAAPTPTKRKKLSYKETKELAELPARIEVLEEEQETLGEVLSAPDTYTKRLDEVPALTARMEAIPAELEVLYTRWTELEDRA
jgi:ATP-binding cassette subfamily F protein uup